MSTRSRSRLVRLTGEYLGTPFEDNASGDGPASGIDERRMDEWGKLDCVTYVEAVLARYFGDAFGRDKALEALRYKRSPSTFLHRNHSISHDWIPNAVSQG